MQFINIVSILSDNLSNLDLMDFTTASAWIQAYAAIIQAIGSILALIIAIFVIYIQNRLQTQRDSRNMKELTFNKYALAVSLGGGIIEKLKKLQGWANASNANQHAVDIDLMYLEIKSMRDDLIQIDLNGITEFEAINKISQFKTYANISVEVVGGIFHEIQNSLNWTQYAITNLQRFSPQYDEFMYIAVDYEKKIKKDFNIHSST